MNYLSAHFTLDELIRSSYATRKGIDNTPNEQVLENLRMLAGRAEGMRDILSVPIIVTSGYRSPKLNSAIGGSKNSAHIEGLALDFIAPEFGSPLDIALELAANKDEIDFDKLIYEGDWVHIQFSDNPRGEILTAHFENGKPIYTRGLPHV